MAFISKQIVAAKRLKLKEICKKYSIKASFSGSNSDTLKCTITEGPIDFIQNYIDTVIARSKDSDPFVKAAIDRVAKLQYMAINKYHTSTNHSGIAIECLSEILCLMHEGHYDNSDAQIDHFDTSWYISIYIGSYDKPYKLIKLA